MQAFKNANSAKSRCILQSTYGSTYKWHPTDYINNVLTYDVHEQIRNILLGLQSLIIASTNRLNEDQITVDFVYCYPGIEGCNGQLSADQKEHWRVITAGDHSRNGFIREFLSADNSFFSHVDKQGYLFYNDKRQCINKGHYIISEKDKEYNSKGSIVGLKIELKNDVPETVFIKGILTVTTYGEKLYDKGSFASKDFEQIFKINLLNSYKSLLISELAQVYIRHVIRDGNMCPKTGRLITKNANDSEKEDRREKLVFSQKRSVNLIRLTNVQNRVRGKCLSCGA